MRRALLVAPLLAALSLVQAQDPTQVPDDAYAVVGSEVILRKTVEAETKIGTPHQALNRLVNQALFRQNLVREGADPDGVTAAQVDAALAKIKERNPSAPLSVILKQSGQTEQQFRRTLRLLVAAEAMLRKRITDEELQEVYDGGGALALAGELRASHIKIAIGPKRELEAAKVRAEALLQRLRDSDGVEDAFAQLATKESDDPLAPLTAGDLDWLQAKRASRSSERGWLTLAAFNHGKKGLVPTPIRTPSGYHLLLITQVRMPKSATFESLKSRLLDATIVRRSAKLVDEWMKETPIHYAPDAPRPGRR